MEQVKQSIQICPMFGAVGIQPSQNRSPLGLTGVACNCSTTSKPQRSDPDQGGNREEGNTTEKCMLKQRIPEHRMRRLLRTTQNLIMAASTRRRRFRLAVALTERKATYSRKPYPIYQHICRVKQLWRHQLQLSMPPWTRSPTREEDNASITS